MRHTWQFMSAYNISIPDLEQGLGLHRLQDCSIMDSFLDKGIKGKIITKANKCRIHLKAFHLSDITTGDGKAITISSWNGALLDTDNRQTDVTWPNWEVIHPSFIKAWQYCLRVTFCTHRERILDTPLGDWTSEPSRHWK